MIFDIQHFIAFLLVLSSCYKIIVDNILRVGLK